MAKRYRIHPSIGIARVGNSPADFYVAPDKPAALPIDCGRDGIPKRKDGKEQPINWKTGFRDAEGAVKRQAARFRVYVYDDESGEEHELRRGETIRVVNEQNGQVLEGPLQDVQWTVYLANKKPSWYQFEQLEGEHGYGPDHPLRNADVTDETLRRKLMIDPGPRTVSWTDEKSRRAAFAREDPASLPQSFPPPGLRPFPIDTLGDLLATCDEDRFRLLVLGGHGNSGSMLEGPLEPKIEHYANNPGWFDDVSDGPVTASLVIKVEKVDGKPPIEAVKDKPMAIPVDDPAWALVGYPGYVPQLLDMITLDEVLYDVAVRELAYDTNLYGVPPFDGRPEKPRTAQELADWRSRARWNPDYHPYFWRDIWPILLRPDTYQWVWDFFPFTGADPHSTNPGGNIDPAPLSIPPHAGEDPRERENNRRRRMFLYKVLRQPGQENVYIFPPDPEFPESTRLIGMPDLCGDNPISNDLPSKFLTLTPTMLFLLRQWARGKFINEKTEHIADEIPRPEGAGGEAPTRGEDLDRGSVANALGGAFCPGAEVTWIVRNPAIYKEPYRIKAKDVATLQAGNLSLGSDLEAGLEPGDLTKYMALPWQADFNECFSQPVDVTYDKYNDIYPGSIGDPVVPSVVTIFWWPTHRPIDVFQLGGPQVRWSKGIGQDDAGDLTMVTAWKELGFVVENPASEKDPEATPYVVVQARNLGG